MLRCREKRRRVTPRLAQLPMRKKESPLAEASTASMRATALLLVLSRYLAGMHNLYARVARKAAGVEGQN